MNVQLGLRANAGQFALLVGINALVGAMVGLERSVLPLIGEQDFGLTSKTAILTFIVAFGLTKAFTNLAAGTLADRVGRKRLLVAGLAARASRAAPDRSRPGLVARRGCEPVPRRLPGARLVDDRRDEDRPGGPQAPGAGARTQRVGRLPRRRHRCFPHRCSRCLSRTAYARLGRRRCRCVRRSIGIGCVHS